MSWFSSNYEKALLGAAILVSLALVWFGWSQLKHSGEDFRTSLRGDGKDNTAVEGAERITKTMQSMQLDHGWKQGIVDDRPVHLFTGIPLFIKRDQPERAVDPMKGPEIHPGIPNSFWLDNDLDPGFADSPLRDPDADGFSNLEEFRAGTDPNDREDHPLLLIKLRYVRDETVSWLLKPGFLNQNNELPMAYEDTKGLRNKAGAGNPVKPGELFFTTGAAQNRFKYLGHDELKQVNPSTNIEETVTLARIEDQKANKAGHVYKIPAPLKAGDRAKHIQHDRSAVMVLEALGAGSQEMIVEENTRFGLPADSPVKHYLLKSVTPEAIEVEYTPKGGQPTTIQIQKGSLPQLPQL